MSAQDRVDLGNQHPTSATVKRYRTALRRSRGVDAQSNRPYRDRDPKEAGRGILPAINNSGCSPEEYLREERQAISELLDISLEPTASVPERCWTFDDTPKGQQAAQESATSYGHPAVQQTSMTALDEVHSMNFSFRPDNEGSQHDVEQLPRPEVKGIHDYRTALGSAAWENLQG